MTSGRQSAIALGHRARAFNLFQHGLSLMLRQLRRQWRRRRRGGGDVGLAELAGKCLADGRGDRMQMNDAR